jgi:hypothetical protein
MTGGDLWQNARYERKYVVNEVHIDALRGWAEQSRLAFRHAFPERIVQSIYFDSPALDDLQDGLSGAGDRRRVRLRWYGEACDVPRAVLEIKCKQNTLGIKLSHEIELPAPLDRVELSALPRIIARRIPDELGPHLESASQPTIALRYRREYMVSADGRIRVTFDREIRSYDQQGYARLNTRHATPFPPAVVMELKYPAEHSEVPSLLDHLPTRMSRFSKYTIGQQALLGV